MLLSSNEKEARQLMQSLMMIHGAYDVMRGATHIIYGIVEAWEAYNAAVAASAAAQTVAAAAATKAALVVMPLE